MKKFKYYLGLVMLAIVVVPVMTPMVVNGQEVTKAEIENIKEKQKEKKEKSKEETIKGLDPTKDQIDIKNTAYGCEGTSCDNTTDYMGSNVYDLNSFEYKIDAITHEITMNFKIDYNFANGKDEGDYLSIKVTDGKKTKEITTNNEKEIKQMPHTTGDYEYMATTGDLSSLGMADQGEYVIAISYGKDDTFDKVTIPVVKTAGGEKEKADNVKVSVPKVITVDGKRYGVIGDNINNKTDYSGVSQQEEAIPNISASGVEEEKTGKEKANYGIYELESILYDGVQSSDETPIINQGVSGYIGNDLIKQEGEWEGSTDLTISKYDHVIRPNNANYYVASNVEAKATSSETTADNVGGFDADGYRAIGQKLSSKDGIDALSFSGEIRGDHPSTGKAGINGDEEQDNTIISNLNINNSTLSNIGLIAKGDDVRVNNIGIVDPTITAKGNVGAVIGNLVDTDVATGEGNSITNVYTLKTPAGTTTGVNGNGDNVGAIAGSVSDTVINSDGRVEGKVEGIDLSSDVQPTLLPDKDGYKTFNTVDVTSTGNNTGGLLGNGKNTEINSAYNKGNVIGLRGTGGITGVLYYGLSENTYNYGQIKGTEGIGGIIGIIMGDKVENINCNNSYNKGNVEGTIAGIGGIVGVLNQGKITNIINNGLIKSTYVGDPESDGGGTAGIVGNTADKYEFYISNAINTANIEGTKNMGGIAGDGSPKGENTVENAINIGNITGNGSADTVGGVTGKKSTEIPNNITLKNTYNYEKAQITNGTNPDSNLNNSGYNIISAEEINQPEFWSEKLFVDDNGINWNIKAGDGSIPSPDNDTSDESKDDDKGTVNNGSVPTIKEIDQDGNITKLEVPEQNVIKLPTGSVIINNYKINAMNLDIALNYTLTNDEIKMVKRMTNGSLDLNFVVRDTTGKEVLRSATLSPKSGTYEMAIPSNNKLEQDKDYVVTLEYSNTKLGTPLTIHTSKQITKDGKTYALIGDGVNKDTYLSGLEEDTTKANPTISGDKYGTYELESILYDGTSKVAGTSAFKMDDGVIQSGEWDAATDLTLSKYDHIVRPNDGKYLIADNIDASVSKDKQEEDKLGGFGTDGFRPIGQKITSIDGNDPLLFICELSGDVDTLLGKTEDNTYISNLYINEPLINNVGMIAKGNGANINNLGIIDPNIIGNENVGSFAGQFRDFTAGEDVSKIKSTLLNIYAAETKSVDPIKDNSQNFDIIAKGRRAGGLVGYSTSTNITSDDRFTGEIPGITEYDPGNQSTELPDKDGYKTFSTVDVQGAGYETGGIIASYGTGILNKLYNKGEVENNEANPQIEPPIASNAGGIVGATAGNNTNINSVYNYGHIIAKHFNGGAAGILTNSNNENIKLNNLYNAGLIEGRGIAGISVDTPSVEIKNVYNSGDLKLLNYDGITEYYAAGINGGPSDVEMTGSFSLENAYNIGTIDSSSIKKLDISGEKNKITISGILLQLIYKPESIVKNCYSGGKFILNDESQTHVSIIYNIEDYANITNTYALETLKDNDLNKESAQFHYVTATDVNDTDWWKNKLFIDDKAASWNIEDGDVNVPNPDIDPSDESQDDDQGAITRGKYPTVKELNKDGTLNNLEVPEQKTTGLPGFDFTIDYKINAMNLNFLFKLDLGEAIKSQLKESNMLPDGQVGLYPESSGPDYKTGAILEQGYNFTTDSGKEFTVSNTEEKLKPSYYDKDGNLIKNNYVVVLKKNSPEGFVITGKPVTITMPVQDGGKDGDINTLSDNYNLIGDNVNVPTDTNGVINSDYVSPKTDDGIKHSDTNTDKYGIYELESIGYEDKQLDSANPEDWSNGDITLKKYDHIIRPLDGRYRIKNNIDASITGSDLSAPVQDVIGGFNGDGMRPIGKSQDYTLDVGFLGVLDGNNKVISNLYINLPKGMETQADLGMNIGMMSQNKGYIHNVNIDKAQVHGLDNVGILNGSNFGYIKDSSVRVDKSFKPNTTYTYVTGDSHVGGLVGLNANDGETKVDKDEDGTKEENGGQIINSSSIGDNDSETYDIQGNLSVGGLVGQSGSLNYSEHHNGDFAKVSKNNFIPGSDGLMEYVANSQGETKIISDKKNSGYSLLDTNKTGDNNSYPTFSTCSAQGNNVIANVGGLVGEANDTQIISVYSKSRVFAKTVVGGLVGRSGYGTDVIKSYTGGDNDTSNSDIDTTAEGGNTYSAVAGQAGGLIGMIGTTYVYNKIIDSTDPSGFKTDSHGNPIYQGYMRSAGLDGFDLEGKAIYNTELIADMISNIDQCYSKSNINITNPKFIVNVGGLTGESSGNFNLTNSYYDGLISSTDKFGGISGDNDSISTGTKQTYNHIFSTGTLNSHTRTNSNTLAGGLYPFGDEVETNNAISFMNLDDDTELGTTLWASFGNLVGLADTNDVRENVYQYKNQKIKTSNPVLPSFGGHKNPGSVDVSYVESGDSNYVNNLKRHRCSQLKKDGTCYPADPVGETRVPTPIVQDSDITDLNWWSTKVNFDTSIWDLSKVKDNLHPQLINVPGDQNGEMNRELKIDKEQETNKVVEKIEETKNTTDVNQLQKDSDSLAKALDLDDEDLDLLLEGYEEMNASEKYQVKMYVEYITEQYKKDPNSVMQYKEELQKILEDAIAGDKEKAEKKFEKLKNQIEENKIG